MVLDILCKLLQIASISPELVEFVSKHDIDPAVQTDFSYHARQLNLDAIAFLSVRPFLE
jgi:hypothetical protein